MTNLMEVKAGTKGQVIAVHGNADFQRRITAVGITPGSKFQVIRNEKKYPLLLNVRNTVLAVNRADCEEITVELNEKNENI